MAALLQTSPATYLSLKVPKTVMAGGIIGNYHPRLISSNGYYSISSTSLRPFSGQKFSIGFRKLASVIVRAKKKDKKEDTHSFISKPDEATGPFPEAVLLKQKKVREDGKVLPEFADAEEEQLFESLMLELESDLNVDQRRHYEVVYLIHEKHVEEVESVNEKVQEFLREKKGKIWRFNDWGMRRLAYKIKKAKRANYILMNFELDAKWINDFKSVLDKDERVIRHIVIKMDEAITEDCPPPPEFHSLRANMDDDEEEHDYDDAHEDENFEDDWDEEEEMDGNDADTEDGIIFVNSDDDGKEYNASSSIGQQETRKLRAEKVGR
ncbi:30S ribosomal protein S6 [Quillaja saponaria]|uniref:30S ribosomal protein S6 n=1 Tax=Quillaja saponaria TaxID=32244 RepID=A0AAD7QFH6_QUISA|nr:30S ribosomal protein S6 [Quillaja saponaria]